MNIIELQERLKDLPENALMQEMQMPSGTAPQFLVLSELKRRKRMRDEYQRQEAQGMQTVAEEAVTAAGAPAQGIMQMSRAMAPQSAIAQNTGVNDMMQQESVRAPQPEQPMMMAEGGIVRRMQDGGNTEEPGAMRRLLENIKERIRAGRMSEEEARFLIENYGMLPEPLNPVSSAIDAVRHYDEGNYPGAALNVASSFPLGRIVGPAMNVAAELYNRAGDRELEPVDEFPVGMADGGYVRRMQTGGFTGDMQQGYLMFLQQMNLADSPQSQQMYMQLMARQQERGVPPETFTPGIDRAPEAMSLSDISTDVGAFMPGAIEPPPSMAMPPALSTPRAGTIDFDASVTASPAAPVMPVSPEPAMEQESDGVYTDALRDYLSSFRGDRGLSRALEADPLDPRSPGFVLPEEEEEAPRVSTGRGGVRQVVGAPSLFDLLASPGSGGDPRSRRSREEAERAAAEAAEMAPQPVEDQSLSFGLGPADVPTTDTELSFGGVTPSAADIPLSMARESGDDTRSEPTSDLDGGGARGGAGGGADFGPIESRIASMLEERERSAQADKWLALAQTGLALMASDQPTLGGAIGEAGLAGIGALQQARSEYDKDIMELLDMQAGVQRSRATGARSEREVDTLSATERAAYFREASELQDTINDLERKITLGGEIGDFGEITREYTPEEMALFNRQLNSARSRASVYSGLSNPALATIQAMDE